MSVFALNDDRSRLESRTFAERAVPGGADTDQWTLENGWRRDFRADGAAAQFAAFERQPRRLTQPAVFVTDQPDARFMGYRSCGTMRIGSAPAGSTCWDSRSRSRASSRSPS